MAPALIDESRAPASNTYLLHGDEDVRRKFQVRRLELECGTHLRTNLCRYWCSGLVVTARDEPSLRWESASAHLPVSQFPPPCPLLCAARLQRAAAWSWCVETKARLLCGGLEYDGLADLGKNECKSHVCVAQAATANAVHHAAVRPRAPLNKSTNPSNTPIYVF